MKKENRKICLSIVLIIVVTLAIYLTSGEEDYFFEGTEIEKSDPGEGERNYSYGVTVGGVELGNVDFVIPEKPYSDEECEILYAACKTQVVLSMLGDNDDLTHVTTDLNFFTSLEGYPFIISFWSDKPDYIGADGELLTDKEFVSTVTVTLNYLDFSRDFFVKVKAYPGEEVKRRVYTDSLKATLDEKKKKSDGKVILPTEVCGEPVRYEAPESKRDATSLLLAPIAILAIFWGKKNDRKKEQKKRSDDILSEYPVLVQKMAIYLSTGMTVRNIWIKIYDEAVSRGKENHPLYKEMGISVNELQSGISEGLVYTGFGERTGISEVIHFTALLSQNLRKGNGRLREVLNEEVTNAYEKRKYRALKKGEEAGTKLLLPMMILLSEVLIMIIIPAFKSL